MASAASSVASASGSSSACRPAAHTRASASVKPVTSAQPSGASQPSVHASASQSSDDPCGRTRCSVPASPIHTPSPDSSRCSRLGTSNTSAPSNSAMPAQNPAVSVTRAKPSASTSPYTAIPCPHRLTASANWLAAIPPPRQYSNAASAIMASPVTAMARPFSRAATNTVPTRNIWKNKAPSQPAAPIRQRTAHGAWLCSGHSPCTAPRAASSCQSRCSVCKVVLMPAPVGRAVAPDRRASATPPRRRPGRW
ncbi:hypothetical protein D3C81_1230710 [compost metagenome]